MSILAVSLLLETGYTNYLLSTTSAARSLLSLRTPLHRPCSTSFLWHILLTSETNTQLAMGFLLFIAAGLSGLTLFRVIFPVGQKPMMAAYTHASIFIDKHYWNY